MIFVKGLLIVENTGFSRFIQFSKPSVFLYFWNINATYLDTGQVAENHQYEAYSILEHGEAIITRSTESHIKNCRWLYEECCTDVVDENGEPDCDK